MLATRALHCAALSATALCFLLSAHVSAQEAVTVSLSDDYLEAIEVAQAQPPEGTLPEVEVRPPAGETFDPGLVDATGDYDTPIPFPSLADQILGGSAQDIGGLNSAIRGEQSIFDIPNNATIVDQELLREKMAPDMFRALQYEVGVLMQATGRGQASVFLRGVTGQQVLVLVDGVRLNNAVLRAGPNQYFNTVDPGQVERIEVIRGAGSVAYGSDAIGGVINIVTRGADPFRGNYAGGEFRQYFSSSDVGSYSRANVEGWVGGSGVFAGASYLDNDDLDIGGGRGRQPFTNYEQYAGDVKYNRMVGEDQMVTVALQHFEQQDLPRSDRFPPFVLGPPTNTPRPTFFDPQQRDLAYVRWQGYAYNQNPLFDLFSFTTSYSFTKEGSREIRSPTRTDLGEFDDDMLGASFVFARDRSEDGLGVLTYGADYYYEDIDAFRFSVNPNNGAITPRAPQYPDDSLSDRAGVFTQWNVPLTQRLDALAGVRYENSNLQGTPTFTINNVATPMFFERTYQDWIASVGLTYKLTDQWNLVGGYYEGYRAPTIDDLTASNTFLQNAQSNPQLGSLGVQPEHSYTYEVGTKYDGERLRVAIYEWWMTIDDYIAREIDGAGNVFLGNHEAYLNGTEVAGEYLLDDTWSVYGNFAYTFGKDLTEQQPFSRIPPTQGVLGLRWRDECQKSYFDVFTWLVNRQERYNPVNFTDSRFPVGGTDGYATLNIRCGTTLGKCCNHRVSLILENITDEYYRVLGSGVDGTGFNALLGYEFVQ
jgi:iron complex outermembrane receptor protein/hemoglobin/transferrin/lactoferrin receptor protein